MITDTIKNLGTYSVINRFIPEIISFLSKTDLTSLTDGKHEIEGEDCFVLVFNYKTKSENGWEAHRKYLDLHIVVSGSEKLSYTSLIPANSVKTYDEQGDYELFEATGDFVSLTGDKFVLLFPQDVHQTGIHTANEETDVKKIVFKLKI